MLPSLTDHDAAAIPITLLRSQDVEAWVTELPATQRAWLAATGFRGNAGAHALLPDPAGSLSGVVQVAASDDLTFALAGLPRTLPNGPYRLDAASVEPEDIGRLALGWALGSYAFDRYKVPKRKSAVLVWPEAADRKRVTAIAEGIMLARDLITTPAEEMGPAELEAAARSLAEQHGAKLKVTTGDDLLAADYPLIHAVGRGSARPPRLIDLTWGEPAAPLLTLVGKGVCFDSGGLDLKPSSAMRLMKKDMGGAATLIGLAHAIMALNLKLRLRLLVPAVENFVSSTSFRPMDVFKTRKGLTVEIGNTDAEGRLVLGDALTEAVADRPNLLIDMATLTGAARAALGPELPALFANDDGVAEDLLACCRTEADPMWRMPLWQPYRKYLDSKIADINNVSENSFAGATVAALYLQEFVEPNIPWIHIDTFAWNQGSRPGRPEGGEALGLRALLRMIEKRFA